MPPKYHAKKWLLRGLGLALISASSLYYYRKFKTGQIKSKIKRVPNSHPVRLTKESLLLLLEQASNLIHPKIRKMTLDARDSRKSLDPSGERYSSFVRRDNQRIMACIQTTLEKTMKAVKVTQSEFENSVEFYRESSVQMKLFNLRKIRSPNPPELEKEVIERILDYFVNVLRGMDEVSQIELLDLEILFTQCEDKVFTKFGVEKTDVEEQAQVLAKTNKSIAEKLRLYQQQVSLKESLFQGNVNLSHLHLS